MDQEYAMSEHLRQIGQTFKVGIMVRFNLCMLQAERQTVAQPIIGSVDPNQLASYDWHSLPIRLDCIPVLGKRG